MPDKEYLRLACISVEKVLPDNTGFLLLTMPMNTENAHVAYAANINRKEAIQLLKEYLFRIGEAEGWMKHIT